MISIKPYIRFTHGKTWPHISYCNIIMQFTGQRAGQPPVQCVHGRKEGLKRMNEQWLWIKCSDYASKKCNWYRQLLTRPSCVMRRAPWQKLQGEDTVYSYSVVSSLTKDNSVILVCNLMFYVPWWCRKVSSWKFS